MTTKPVNTLYRRTLLLMMSVIIFGYPTAILLLGQEPAIEVGNIITVSLACGIVVTYTPTAWAIIKYPVLDGASILSFGIWLGWSAIMYRTGGAIIWRLLDKPDNWLDSGWWGLHIALSCCSAIGHLIAPEAVNGRVPTKEWIRIGILVAVSVLVAGLLTSLNLAR